MGVRCKLLIVFPIWLASGFATAINVPLGTAGAYAVLAGSTVTNIGPTNIIGNLGVWPGSAVTGIPPGLVNGGTVHAGDANAMQAQNDLTTAFNFAAGEAPDQVLGSAELGGLILTPGVYFLASSAQLTGTLTLDALGDPNAVFVFQIGSALTTASNSSVVFTNGGQGNNLFWKVGSDAVLGTTTSFQGTILALTSVTLNTGASLGCGRALALNGAVTLDSNNVSVCTADLGSSVPEPAPMAMFAIGAAACGLLRFLPRAGRTS